MKIPANIEMPIIQELTDDSLDEACRWCLTAAGERITWYRRRSRNFRFWSKTFRILTLILLSLGILAPLYESVLGRTPLNLNFVELGYLALAVGGVLFLFDKAFGLSKGWIRFMTTLIRLQNEVRLFQIEWIAARAEKAALPARVEMMREFITSINKLTESETIQWAAEFENSLALLESLTKTTARK